MRHKSGHTQANGSPFFVAELAKYYFGADAVNVMTELCQDKAR
ncbi:MAG TPA: hypothetical protein VF466_01555 [Candidatus Saccharimonadales bacterium]